jgi:outer membrane receptor for ferrienterochelin and colicin
VLGSFGTKTDTAKKKSSNVKSSRTKSRDKYGSYTIFNLSATYPITASVSLPILKNTSFVIHL